MFGRFRRKQEERPPSTYRVVQLGPDHRRVFSEAEWVTLSPDDQAQYEVIQTGIATAPEALALVEAWRPKKENKSRVDLKPRMRPPGGS